MIKALSVEFDLVSIQDSVVVARAYIQLFLQHESLSLPRRQPAHMIATQERRALPHR